MTADNNFTLDMYEPRGVSWANRWWQRFMHTTSHQQLTYALSIVRAELASICLPSADQESGRSTWLFSANELLKYTGEALRNDNPELGWRCLKATIRYQIYGLSQDALSAKACTILSEACDEQQGVSAWRKSTIRALLANAKGELNKRVTAEQVAQAARLLDEHQNNVYQKLIITQARLRTLTLIGTIALTVWLAVSPPVGKLAATSTGSIMDIRLFWWSVILAGIIGALVSGFIASIRPDKKARIPVELANSTVMYARFTLAALSVVIVSIFLSSGLLNLGQLNYEITLVAAFISGFSERLLLRTIESVTKNEAGGKSEQKLLLQR